MPAQFPTTTGAEAARWCPTGSGDGHHIAGSAKIVDLIADKVAQGKPFCSFEYFPPRTDDGVKNLYERIERMALQQPLFIDFTWGAGGSTSELTVELCTKSKAMTGLDINMHMTCTNQPVHKVDEGLAGAIAGGIRNICALRGDPPLGQDKWEAVKGGFNCALDLVKHIRKTHGSHFGISVSGYPEGHPDNIKPTRDLGRELTASEKKRVMRTAEGEECVCSDEDYAVELKYLKEKIDAGGEVIITQLFYDVEVFIQFAKDCKAAGIHAPILPGIMIIQLNKKMESMKDDAEAIKAFGIEFGAELCSAVLKSGLAPGLHFYTLNLEKSTLGIMEKLGMKKAETAVGNESENTFAGTLINTVIKN